MARREPVLGVDFGTTNSAAVWADGEGGLHPVPVRSGDYTLPSVVCFHGGGRVLVGEPARQMVVHDPANTIYGIKRFMGRRFFSDYVGRHRGQFGFGLVEGPDGDVAVRIRGRLTTLEEVATHIIARLAELAAIAAGAPFHEGVVAVPAHFGHRQRRVIRRAMTRAGLKVSAIINEPTAAALYHARHASLAGAETLLVYDLGGGTFDTTLLRAHQGRAEVLSTGGEAFLGGADIDQRVADHLATCFEDKHGPLLESDSLARQRLLFAAEGAKIKLSHLETTSVIVPCLSATDEEAFDLREIVDRTTLETLCAPLIEKTMGITLQVVGNSGLHAEDVDEVVLVGGQTKMPVIGQRLRQVTKTSAPKMVGGRGTGLASDAYDADLAVAAGAALMASGSQTLVDVVAMPLGIRTPHGGPQEAIGRNASLPAIERLPLGRPQEGQPLSIVLYESVDETSIDRDVLGTATVPADWLASHPDVLELKVSMTSDFDVGISVQTAGEELPLPLVERATTPVGEAPRETPAEPRSKPRTPLAVGVTLHRPDQPLSAVTENLATGGMFLAVWRTLAVGDRHRCTLNFPSGPLELDAEVVHLVDDDTAVAIGQNAGVGLKFVDLLPFQIRMLDDALRALEGGAPPDPPSSSSSPSSSVAPSTSSLTPGLTDELSGFVQAVEADDFYGALGADPLTGREELATQIFRLQRELKQVPGAQPDEIHHANRLLELVSGTLLQPRRRLEHDFRQGYDFAPERLKALGPDEGQRLLLREAWRRVHPDRVDAATVLVAKAVKAHSDGDLATAVALADKALQEDPFDGRLASMVEGWRGSLAAGEPNA